MKKFNEAIRDIEVLKKYLPHREPMIMIDALIDHNKGGSISELTILDEMMFVKNSVFSESGILEHMAQTAAIHTGYRNIDGVSKPRVGYIAAIQNAEFFNKPMVSDVLRSELSILFESDEMCKFEIKTSVENRSVAVATMTTILSSI